MAETLFASFASRDDAERATGALMDHGMKSEDITLVAAGTEEEAERWRNPADLRSGDSAYDAYGRAGMRDVETGAERAPAATVSGLSTPAASHHAATQEDADRKDDDDKELSAKTGLSTTTAEDAGAGAMAGAGIGAGIGALAALGTLFLPGVGLVVGGGALATAIAGAVGTAAAGAVAGGVTGYLVDMGVDADTAKTYHETVTGGGAVLSLHLPSGDFDVADARDVLTKYEATNISSGHARA